MKKVLYLVEDEKSAQFRYRVKNVAGVLDGVNTEWSVEWTLKDDLNKIDLERFDLVVILRQTDKDGSIGKFIDLTHKAGKKVLFDLDDLIFDYRDLPLLMRSTNSRNVFYWAGYFWGIRRIAKKVDGFLCTNDFLGKKLKRSFKKPYKVIPNSLNKEQIEVSEKCSKEKDRENFIIGYFSGSPTHVKDFGMIEPELVRFLDRYDTARLKVVGYMEPSGRVQELMTQGRVEFLELVDYLNLQKLMAKVDVNIAPLVVNDFTNCKSELKFFEAAVVETTTIASPNYSFKKVIKDGEDGFLAKPGEWYSKLEYLHKHPKENKIIAKRAKTYALEHYYGKEFLKKVEEAYDYFAK